MLHHGELETASKDHRGNLAACHATGGLLLVACRKGLPSFVTTPTNKIVPSRSSAEGYRRCRTLRDAEVELPH